MTVKVYVEGGGDHNKALQTECRRGFSEFFQKAGFEGRMPRVVACGGREEAYRSFKTSRVLGEVSILLVDSEATVLDEDPWAHVQWTRPQGATEDQLHFMVQTMEAWFHADKDALQKYYKKDFRIAALSQRPDIENIPKSDLYDGLKRATKDCQKGEYSKGEHSFQILAMIDPKKVSSSSPHAARLLGVLDRVSVQ